MYSVSTLQGFIWLNCSHICGANCIIAAAIKVHCLYDVICCLAVDWERLQESFSWLDMKTLRKSHVLGVKSALECYRSLKES